MSKPHRVASAPPPTNDNTNRAQAQVSLCEGRVIFSHLGYEFDGANRLTRLSTPSTMRLTTLSSAPS